MYLLLLTLNQLNVSLPPGVSLLPETRYRRKIASVFRGTGTAAAMALRADMKRDRNTRFKTKNKPEGAMCGPPIIHTP